MLKNLLQLSANKWYWLAFLVLGISLEGTALFYQYVQEYLPCVLCIHVRIFVLGMMSVSLLALVVYKSWFGLFFVQLLMTALSAGLFERSYQLLGTERGFIIGSCNMESGLPGWFALDRWFPSVFEVQEACGYTPELLLGVTMAEALIVLSAVFLFVSLFFSVTLFMARFFNKN
jgi:protein dithiol:quinone oxidoreductase